MPPPLLLFAYGALLSPAVLARRGVDARVVTPAVAPSHAVAFAHRGGYATLAPAAAAARWRSQAPSLVSPLPAHGALLQLASRDLDTLAEREGGYRLVEIDVRPSIDGRSLPSSTCVAFASAPGMTLVGGPLPPRAAYKAKVAAGAAACGLDGAWRRWLDGVPTVDDGGPLPAAYQDTLTGRVAGVFAAGALVAVGVVAATR